MQVKDHWDNVARLGCCLSHTKWEVTIHHVHGGSCLDAWGKDSPGAGLRNQHWLVLPLAAKYHVGDFGIDAGMGVGTWEKMFGTQVYWLSWVNDRLEYDMFDLAKVPEPIGWER